MSFVLLGSPYRLLKRIDYGRGDTCGLQLHEMPPWQEVCWGLDWQHHLVEDGYFGKKDYGFCGVYRLIALASKGELSRPAALNRACGQDISGTLYIGEPGNLSRRLNQLRRSAGHRRESSHGAISMLRQIARNPVDQMRCPKSYCLAAMFREHSRMEGGPSPKWQISENRVEESVGPTEYGFCTATH
jgi:hypothetical protein